MSILRNILPDHQTQYAPGASCLNVGGISRLHSFTRCLLSFVPNEFLRITPHSSNPKNPEFP
jgi:hypothetical protein